MADASRGAPLGRLLEMSRLERCERGLAAGYRRAGRMREAARHLEHAALLQNRIAELGGVPALGSEPDDDWLSRGGEGDERLRRAELESIHVYHDHLTDLDALTRGLVRERILPDHDAALVALASDASPTPEV